MEAARAAIAERDYLTQCMALRHLAVIRSIHGDHRGALSDLKRLLPIMHWVGAIYPSEYCEHLNSLAVELGETGNVEEAHRAVDFALSSQFASAYPHWKETKLELASKPERPFAPIVFAVGAWYRIQESLQPDCATARQRVGTSVSVNPQRSRPKKANGPLHPATYLIWSGFIGSGVPHPNLSVVADTLSERILCSPARAPPLVFPA